MLHVFCRVAHSKLTYDMTDQSGRTLVLIRWKAQVASSAVSADWLLSHPYVLWQEDLSPFATWLCYNYSSEAVSVITINLSPKRPPQVKRRFRSLLWSPIMSPFLRLGLPVLGLCRYQPSLDHQSRTTCFSSVQTAARKCLHSTSSLILSLGQIFNPGTSHHCPPSHKHNTVPIQTSVSAACSLRYNSEIVPLAQLLFSAPFSIITARKG